MPRYLIERTFHGGVRIPDGDEGDLVCAAIVLNNARHGVTWLHSYMSEDRRKLYCVYEGPTTEAIREAAGDSNLPIDSIVAVRVVDPYSSRESS